MHTKEVVSDYPNYPVKVVKITKSLGQTFYEVEGETHPVIRADLILYKKGEAPVAEEEPKEVAVPHVSLKRLRVRARVAREEAKAVKDAAKAETMANAKAAKAAEKAKKQAEKADLLATAKRMRERSKAK